MMSVVQFIFFSRSMCSTLSWQQFLASRASFEGARQKFLRFSVDDGLPGHSAPVERPWPAMLKRVVPVKSGTRSVGFGSM